MLDWWIELPAGARIGFPLVILRISAAQLFLWGVFWPWSWTIGVILLMFNGMAGSNRWA